MLCASCSNNDPIEVPSEQGGIRFTISDFEFDASSRTAVEITDQAAVFTWAANDTIGIFPDADASQARFVMTAGAGTKTASFDGGGWALRADAKYASYYPYIPDVNLDKTRIPVNYTGQVQKENATTSHLGKYDFMGAAAIVPTDGEVSFDYRHLGCLLQMKLTLPEAGSYTSVTLKSEEKIFPVKGTYDLMSSAIAITPNEWQDSLLLSLEEVQTTDENQVLTAYIMIAPAELSGHEVAVIVRSEKNLPAEGKVALKNFVAGTAYSLASSLTVDKDEEGGGNEGGGNEEKPIEDGVTEITTAGTLDDLLGDTKFQIAKLAIKGKINSDDIALLRQMSGGYRDTTDVENGLVGVLKELDLSKASIVVGGSYYMDNGDTKYRVRNANEIDACMFFGCTVLETLVLPDNVTTIGEAAMSSCSNLTTVVIPSGVTSIGVAAFNSCKNLVQINLPQGLTELGSDTFHSCESLQSISIPSGVSTIGVNTFGHCKNLTEIILSEGLQTIGNAAFGACEKLVTIVIPNSVIEMGERTFASCTSLENVTLSSGQSQLKSYTFENCTALKKVVIPEGMSKILPRAFQYCANITDITLPASMTSLGDRAFYAAAANSPIVVKCHAVNPPILGTDVWKGGDNVGASILYVPSDHVASYKSSMWINYFGQVRAME